MKDLNLDVNKLKSLGSYIYDIKCYNKDVDYQDNTMIDDMVQITKCYIKKM